MRVYTIFPEPWDAAKKVYGSQGTIQNRRFAILGDEFDRVIAYQQKGDIATFDEFFAYMKKRPEIQ